MKKWQSYLSEILLIIIGINLGLWVNNLNANYKENKLERKLLRELHNDLEQDFADAKSNVMVHLEALRKIEKATQFLDQATIRTDLDSIIYYAQACQDWTFLISKQSTYESLKSIGFQIIKNDEIRQMLTDLQQVDYRYIAEFEEIHRNSRDGIYNKIQIILGLTALADKDKDWNRIRNEVTQLRVALDRITWSNFRLHKIYTDDVNPHLEKLLAAISAELQ